MNLDDSIRSKEDMRDLFLKKATENLRPADIEKFKSYAAEYNQMAEWLKELRTRREDEKQTAVACKILEEADRQKLLNIGTPWHTNGYQPPLELIMKDIQTEMENNILTAVQNYGIHIEKDELIKALDYDRQQYEKGFKDGRASASEFKWIPITSRPMTKEEEKEVCEQWGVKELEGWEKRVFTCQLPEDGQEILISTSWGVRMDKCEWDPDSGCGLEENGDWDGIKAWMPLPKQYEEEPEDE